MVAALEGWQDLVCEYGSRERVGSGRLERRFADAAGSKGLLFDFGSSAAFAL